MSQNSDITQDDLVEEIRADNTDSINFFNGTEITILHKNISEPVDEETQKQMAGLETMILSFSASPERIAFNEMLLGGEDLQNDLPKKRSIVKTVIQEVIKFLRNVAAWIFSLLTNRIRRAENNLIFLEQRRKVNGIKQGKINYTESIKSLLSPTTVSQSPTWVILAASQGLSFYKKSVRSHKKMIELIQMTPTTPTELKEQKVKVLSEIGRIMCNGNTTQIGFSTDMLPGNKFFNVDIESTYQGRNPFYYTESPAGVVLKSKTWEVSSGVINNAIVLLKEYIAEIKKEQSTAISLSKNFEKRIRAIGTQANNWTTAYYNWLIEINRKFISLTFQQTMRWYGALESFVSSGVR